MAAVFIYGDNLALSAELLALAKTAGQEVCALTLSGEEASDLIKYGADKVFVLKGDNPWPESYAKPMARLLKEQGAAAFMAGATVRGRDIAARVAAYLQCGLVSDAGMVSFENDHLETSRMMYGGATVLTEVTSGFTVITVPVGKQTVSADNSHSGEVVTVSVETDNRVKQAEISPIARQGADLSKADRIVCIGMGFDKQDDMKIARDLAGALGAEIGCTRGVAEDRGWLPTECYIGISGVIVKPDLYLALGVSGQVQHTFGIRDSKLVVGINNNEKAPIFKASDYGIVGDLYEIAPLLTEAIKNS